MRIDFLDNIALEISYPKDSFRSQELYIADITGNDSIAALIETVKKEKPRFILPSVILLGCEFGDKNQTPRIIAELADALRKHGVKMLDGILLDINALWKLFIGNSMNHMVEEYGFFSPCIACHLLMHISRIKLSQYFGSTNVISGERELHGSREKINQLPFVLELYEELFKSAGVTHHTPIRHLRDDDCVKSIVNSYGLSSVKLDCLFSGTYYDQAGKIAVNKTRLLGYVRHYIFSKLDELTEKTTVRCSPISSRMS